MQIILLKSRVLPRRLSVNDLDRTIRYGQWEIWLGRQDSNLGMAESKSAALPLGYAPKPLKTVPPIRGEARGRCTIVKAPLKGNPKGLQFPMKEQLAEPQSRRYKAASSRFGAGAGARGHSLLPQGISPGVNGETVGRSVAQPGSALASGARGREFESPAPTSFSKA